MEDFNFDIEGILSDEEAATFFSEEDDDKGGLQDPDLEEETGKPEEGVEENGDQNGHSSDGVDGDEENEDKEQESAEEEDGGFSPNVLSSVAEYLKNGGTFPDLSEDDYKDIDTPEKLAEFIDKGARSLMDERMRRIDEFMKYGATRGQITQDEKIKQTVDYLNGISSDSVKAEGKEGDDLRGYLIYNDYIKRGFSDERARREVKKAFDSGSDIEDAEDALNSLKNSFGKDLDNSMAQARRTYEDAQKKQKETAEKFRKMVIDQEIALGDQKLDKTTRQKVYDAVSTPVWKDPDTGKLLTPVQKFQKENPLEFMKQIGLWYVLTDGGKNIDGFTKGKVRSEKNKAIRDLANRINATSVNSDGTLRFTGMDKGGSDDILLSDDWKIG